MTEGDLTQLPIGQLWAHRVDTQPDDVFVEFRDRALTYAEVDATANRIARGLTASGVRPGDHVTIMMPNCAEFVYAVLALVKLAVVVVPINTANRGESLRHVLSNSDSSTLIADAQFGDQLSAVLPGVPGLRRVVVHGADPSDAASAFAGTNPIMLSELISHPDDPVLEPAGPSDVHAIMYTSGTTGPAKGVLVPHRLALANASDVRTFSDCADKTIYCPLPLFHAAALWDGLFSTILAGARIAIVERFSASRFWDDVRKFNAQVVLGVPSMIPILMSAPPSEQDTDHPLEAFYTGKSALDDMFTRRFGVRSVETYTSTEIGVGTASPFGRWRSGSCGQVNGDRFDAAVVDDSDEFVGPGQAGELVLRPKQQNAMALGYYNAPEATAKAFRNAWFHTGDRVYRDEDGYFYFVDRMKDAIRRRGENISAFDIECAVDLHPDVVECAAIAVPSEMEEDEVKLVAVLAAGATTTHEQIVEFCEKSLPTFAVPRFVEFVAELPKTANGKVAKFRLREAGERGITPGTWDRQRA